jgi:hypothetical protein
MADAIGLVQVTAIFRRLDLLPLSNVLRTSLIDILFSQDKKLDESFPMVRNTNIEIILKQELYFEKKTLGGD